MGDISGDAISCSTEAQVGGGEELAWFEGQFTTEDVLAGSTEELCLGAVQTWLRSISPKNCKGGNSVYATGPARPVSRWALHEVQSKTGNLITGTVRLTVRSLFIDNPGPVITPYLSTLA